MNNRKDFVSFNTGGHTAHHSRDKDVEVQRAVPPMKSTGEVPNDEGRAKASPKFEDIKPSAKASKKEEKNAIDDNTELVIDTEDNESTKDTDVD